MDTVAVSVVEHWLYAVMEWVGWAPLSRLTYCTYLIHPMVIKFFYKNLHEPEHLADYNMVHSCFLA